jgi:hypothetical protein
MAIGIRGIRLDVLTVNLKPDDSEEKVSGTYSLISTADKVLAQQSFNSYNGLKMPLSPGTHKALTAFIELYKADINAVLGLE